MGVKVLHIIDQLKGGGGAEIRLMNDLKLIDKKLIQNTVFCLFPPEKSFVEILKQLGVKIYWCDRQKFLFKFAYLVNLIIKIKPDVVHTQLFFSDVLGRISAFLCWVPIIISTFQSSVHEPNVLYYYSRKRRLLDFLTSKLGTHFIAVSEFVRNSVSKRLSIPLEKISVIYNYVELKETSATKKKKNSILLCCVSKLNPAKGQFELIKALEKLILEGEAVKLLLIGDGPNKEDYKKYVIRKKLENYVTFLGNTNQVNEILKNCDAFVFPTHSEGLSLALLEAVLSKKICLISSILSNLEVVSDKDCFTFEVKNSDSIYKSIRNFLELNDNNPKKLKEMTESAYKKALKKFNPVQKAKELEELYVKLCG